MSERSPGKAARRAAFLLISSTLFSAAASAQLAISPVRVDLGSDNTKDVIRVTSQGTEPRSYEVEVVAWSQEGDEREVYTPTDEVLAVPPLFTLEPGAEQVVRIGMVSGPDSDVERAYRMFITELASPQADKREQTGVNVRVRLGIPVFVAPEAEQRAALALTDGQQSGDTLRLEFKNAGNTHVRISEVRYLPPGGQAPSIEAAAVYILAGQSGSLPVTVPGGDRAGTVTLVTDTLGDVEYDLSALP